MLANGVREQIGVNFFFFVIYVYWLIIWASPDFPVYLPFCVM